MCLNLKNFPLVREIEEACGVGVLADELQKL